jgi:methyl-accepting chemotaxis protein
MRSNLPVTQKEFSLKADCSIVSKTDLKGRLTYVNPEFVEAAGYTEAELIGQPHNIIRHPDMPEEAFRDLWDTLKSGRPWTALVKNRRSNGDHYWVVANATPIREAGEITGYMSVRNKATPEQVASAEAAYALFRSGRASGMGIYEGRIVRTGLFARIMRLPSKLRIAHHFGVLNGLFLIAAATGWFAVNPAVAGANRTLGLYAAGIMLLTALTYSGLLALGIARKWSQVASHVEDLAQGNFERNISATGADESSEVLRGLQSLRTQIGFQISDARRLALASARIQEALDGVTTNVMIADVDLNIIYMNRTMVEMLKRAESDIQKDLPRFDASDLLGANIDVFHKNPAHQRHMLAGLSATHRAAVYLGGRTFSLTVTPVKDAQGVRLGSAVEWVDRTDEVAVEKEVSTIVTAAGAGDFSQRIAIHGKSGFFRQLGEGINELMQTSETGLNEVVRMLGALSRGDLTERIDAEYSGTFGALKDDSNRTTEQLVSIVGEIREASEAINTAAREIAAGNTDLSSRTEEQAASLQETAASMEELTGTVKQNAQNAVEANQLAISASSVAVEGGKVVESVVQTMEAINDSSKKIADIIGVIDGIAFQTNILALNAAVEAARAGDQGRGFAVVATEVRSLAQRSAAAAKEIKELIGNSQTKVGEGARLVEGAGKTMAEVVTSVKKVADIIAEISSASLEQSTGIEQVNQAIAQMDQVTQQNAALVEEAAAAAESMEEQARGLITTIGVFKLAHSEGRPMEQVSPRAKPDAGAKSRGSRAARTASAATPKKALLIANGAKDWEEF